MDKNTHFPKNWKKVDLLGTGGPAVYWIDHKTIPFDNLYQGMKIDSRKSHPKGREIVEKSNLKDTLWRSAPAIAGARFGYANETFIFRPVMSHPSHVIQKTADPPVPIRLHLLAWQN